MDNNIDRCAVIWQYLHEKSWFEDSGKSLWPFRSSRVGDRSEFWTSDLARYSDAFGYSCPDLHGSPTPEKLKNDFAHRYRWSEKDENGISLKCPEDMKPVDVSQAQLFQPVGTAGALMTAPLPGTGPSSLGSKETGVEPDLPKGKLTVRDWKVDSQVAR